MSKGLRIGSPEWEEAERNSKTIQAYRRMVDNITEIIEAGDDEHGGYHVWLDAWKDIAQELHKPYNKVYYAIEDALQRVRYSDGLMIRHFLEALEALYPEQVEVPEK